MSRITDTYSFLKNLRAFVETSHYVLENTSEKEQNEQNTEALQKLNEIEQAIELSFARRQSDASFGNAKTKFGKELLKVAKRTEIYLAELRTVADHITQKISCPSLDLYVTAINDAKSFYAVIMDESEYMPRLSFEGKAQLETMPKLGDLVLVQSTNDDLWYRGKVTVIDHEISMITVFRVDTGGYEECHISEILTLYERHAKLPFRAVLCHMCGLEKLPTDDAELKDKAVLQLQKLLFNQRMNVILAKKISNNELIVQIIEPRFNEVDVMLLNMFLPV